MRTRIPRAVWLQVMGTPYRCDTSRHGPGCGELVPAGHCTLCHRPGADTLDHGMPVSMGGTNAPENLRPAHHACNSRRGAHRHGRAVGVVVEPW